MSLSNLEQFRRETGQTMAEYTVVLGVITLAIVLTIGAMSGAIQNVLDRVTSFL